MKRKLLKKIYITKNFFSSSSDERQFTKEQKKIDTR